MSEVKIKVACSECGATAKAPEKFVGAERRCPKCGEKAVFDKAAPDPLQEPAPEPKPQSSNLPDVVPSYEIMENKDCPACGESIKAVAKKCRFCGEIMDPEMAAKHFRKAAEIMPKSGNNNVNVNVDTGKSTSGLGIAALLMGVFACLVCWIPFLGIISWPIAGLGLIFGCIGLIFSLAGRKSGIGVPVAGIAVCITAVLVSFVITRSAAHVVSDTMDEIEKDQEEANRSAPAEGKEEPHQEPQKITWLGRKDIGRLGNIKMRIRSISIGKTALKMISRQGESGEEFLNVSVDIKNDDDSKKAEYKTWRSVGFSMTKDYAVATDENENIYKRIDFGFATDIEGAVKSSESLYPQKSVSDIIVFEKPIEKAEIIYLEFPGYNVGQEGVFRYRIPMNEITIE